MTALHVDSPSSAVRSPFGVPSAKKIRIARPPIRHEYRLALVGIQATFAPSTIVPTPGSSGVVC